MGRHLPAGTRRALTRADTRRSGRHGQLLRIIAELLLPERRGNNRVDSLRNIVADPRVALPFMIPGVGETLRVNGTARISTDPVLLQQLAMEGKPPSCVLVIHVQTAFFQCARAMQRSRLWSPPAGHAVLSPHAVPAGWLAPYTRAPGDCRKVSHTRIRLEATCHLGLQVHVDSWVTASVTFAVEADR
ncbi:MAG TPA: pyridoxamine 5'-phosphate oxidase family protein [Myxococcaceae bacterium]|nr:pyridoxamine 5'-phosphate oxidase family protein [Myxococcaceae bacterium]